MKSFQNLLGAIIFIIIGILIGWGIPRATDVAILPETAETQEIARQVSLMVDEGDGTIKTFTEEAFEQGESLFDLTARITEREGMSFVHEPPGEFGILITEIDGKIGGTGGKYWLYWVEGAMGQVASDAYELQTGDVIEWKFINLKF